MAAVTPTRSSSSSNGSRSKDKDSTNDRTQQQQPERHSAFVFSGFGKVTPTRRTSSPPDAVVPPKAPKKKKSTTNKTSAMDSVSGSGSNDNNKSPPKSSKSLASAIGRLRSGSKKSPEGIAAAAALAAEARGDEPDNGAGVPSKLDILCGQSRICASHAGNRRFQAVLDIYAPRYDSVTSKQEKMFITKEIVACIRSAGGRFLKFKAGLWEEISDVTARDKVSHALRTKVASWKRQQEETANGDKSSTAKSKSATKPSHRRGGGQRSRRSSGSSVATNASDIVTTSFDGNDSASANVMGELIKAQREIFASLTTSTSSDVKTDEKATNSTHPLKKKISSS
jgi:hypothetical protein